MVNTSCEKLLRVCMARDIDTLSRSAEDDEQREGVRPKLMVATSDVSPNLMQNIMGLPRPIEMFSYEGED